MQYRAYCRSANREGFYFGGKILTRNREVCWHGGALMAGDNSRQKHGNHGAYKNGGVQGSIAVFILFSLNCYQICIVFPEW